MITFILLTILLSCVLIIQGWDRPYNFLDWALEIASAFAKVLVATLIALLLTVLMGMIFPPATQNKLIQSTTIVSLKDNTTTTGSFFLGCGSVDSEPSYSFYTKHNDQYTLESVNANRTLIEFTNQSPCIDIYEKQVIKKGIRRLIGLSTDAGSKSYVIKIPEGSIIQTYVLDAE
jgi:hypothetical protein